MGGKIEILDAIVIGALYLSGFAVAVNYARSVGESWATLTLPALGIMAAGGGIWYLIRKKIK